RRLQAVPVEEVLGAVLGGDETEPAIGHDLLDGAVRHDIPLFSKHALAHADTVSRMRGLWPRRRHPAGCSAASLSALSTAGQPASVLETLSRLHDGVGDDKIAEALLRQTPFRRH